MYNGYTELLLFYLKYKVNKSIKIKLLNLKKNKINSAPTSSGYPPHGLALGHVSRAGERFFPAPTNGESRLISSPHEQARLRGVQERNLSSSLCSGSSWFSTGARDLYCPGSRPRETSF